MNILILELNFTLKLNELGKLFSVKIITALILSTTCISLQYCHKLPDVLEHLSLYSIKLYIDITISMSLALSICVLLISLMQ